MITVQEAIAKARQYLGAALSSEQVFAVRLEEVVLSEDDKFWYITLSFVWGNQPGAMAAALGADVPRQYKVLEISADDGKVHSMKIRQLA